VVFGVAVAAFSRSKDGFSLLLLILVVLSSSCFAEQQQQQQQDRFSTFAIEK